MFPSSRAADDLAQDLRVAVRGIRTYPVACAVAVLSLAAGIGETTATLTVRQVVFHNPPPLYADPAQLSQVQLGTPDRPVTPVGSGVPARLFEIWRDDPSLNAQIAAAAAARLRDVRVGDRRDSVRVRAVTPDLFSVLGVAPAVGRTFDGSERADGPARVVLSDRVWRSAFDSRPDVVGALLWIDDVPHEVIGVMPPRFWFSDTQPVIWTRLDPAPFDAGELEVVARRSAGMPASALAAALDRGVDRYARTLPAGERRQALKVSPVEGTPIAKQVSEALPWLLAGAVVLTLLIACANVAILMTAQWTAREREIAIRASLGAGRTRLLRQLLTESTVIAAAAGALGMWTTSTLRDFIAWRIGAEAAFYDLSIDPRIFVETAIITLGAGLAAGFAPALYETRHLHGNPLRQLAIGDRARQQVRHALVGAEIAVTVALLVAASALLDGYRRNMSADVGFSTHPLLAIGVANDHGVPVNTILDALRGLPNVAAAAAATSAPYAGAASMASIADDAGSRAVQAERVLITPAFFQTLGVPMRSGRAFTALDTESTRTVIVNEPLARRLFGASAAEGRTIRLGSARFDIVGVVAAYSDGAFEGERARDSKLFLPLGAAAAPEARLSLIVRAQSAPGQLADTARRLVRATSSETAVTGAYTFDQIIAVAGQEILVGTAPLFPLILTGIVLTAAGIYGVLAFAMMRRSKELAVRVAIGAAARHIAAIVAAQSGRLVLIGTAAGVAATFALVRLARALGGGGTIYDPRWPAFVLPVLIVGAIAACATWVPARRAMRIDPAAVLRSD